MYFFIDISHFILQKNIRSVYLLDPFGFGDLYQIQIGGDSNKYTKRIIYKNKCSKHSVTDSVDGSFQVSL